MKPEYIIIHHTATHRDTTTFEGVNKYHTKLWNYISTLGYGIGYHYFIDHKGIIKQGRADNEMGAHCRADKMNFRSLGVCLAGNFSKEMPTREQTLMLQKLLLTLQKRHDIPDKNILAHREVDGRTECFGTNLPDNYGRALVNKADVVVKTLEEVVFKLQELIKQLTR